MSATPYTFDSLEAFVDRALPATGWLPIEQDRIDAFAGCTDDRQWIHLDRERARAESAQGTTIAHGLLVLGLLPRFSYEAGLLPAGASHALNYGFDKVRFLSPVPSGARVRDTITVVSVQRKSPTQALVGFRHRVDIEGGDKPALIAEALNLFVAAPASAAGGGL